MTPATIDKGLLAALLVAIAAIIWLTVALVRTENERYAMTLGMCMKEAPFVSADYECLKTIRTRTAWWWHVYYALRGSSF